MGAENIVPETSFFLLQFSIIFDCFMLLTLSSYVMLLIRYLLTDNMVMVLVMVSRE